MPNILLLGGTQEATQLARALAAEKLPTTLSYAGRVAQPRAQPVPVRSGGFGGADGLADYLRRRAITHLIDATHPFAAQISYNAAQAALATGRPLIALTRPPWTPMPGDDWTHTPDIAAAVTALDRPPECILLAIGRQNLAAFAAQPQHRYTLRLVDPPETPPPLPDHHLIIDRGPFTPEAEIALLRDHGITRIVSKNSGGSGAQAKLIAARQLRLPVVMIDRPASPKRRETADITEILSWLRETR